MKNKNLTEEREKQLAIKIIRGHLKLITKCVAYCLERLDLIEGKTKVSDLPTVKQP